MMAATGCPHCGYDLSGSGVVDGYGTRVCPECGGASRFADVPMPLWMLSPWRFDGALALMGVPWGMVGYGLVEWDMATPRNSIVFDIGISATIVLGVVCAFAWVLWVVLDLRRTLGRGLIGVWVPVRHMLVAVVGVPVVWVVTMVVVEIAMSAVR